MTESERDQAAKLSEEEREFLDACPRFAESPGGSSGWTQSCGRDSAGRKCWRPSWPIS
jgi:hypothetical protein